MSRTLILGLAFLAASLLGRPAGAQSRGRSPELDALSRYGSSKSQGRSHSSQPLPRPPVQVQPAPRYVHDYYPGMRTGQYANRNIVTHPLCVPGRRALIGR
jgi:hypothetical protein